jgi:hypothetical protein
MQSHVYTCHTKCISGKEMHIHANARLHMPRRTYVAHTRQIMAHAWMHARMIQRLHRYTLLSTKIHRNIWSLNFQTGWQQSWPKYMLSVTPQYEAGRDSCPFSSSLGVAGTLKRPLRHKQRCCVLAWCELSAPHAKIHARPGFCKFMRRHIGSFI